MCGIVKSKNIFHTTLKTKPSKTHKTYKVGHVDSPILIPHPSTHRFYTQLIYTYTEYNVSDIRVGSKTETQQRSADGAKKPRCVFYTEIVSKSVLKRLSQEGFSVLIVQQLIMV